MNAPERRIQDFSTVSYEEAIQRARDLIPFLREHGPKGETVRHMPPEIEEALHHAGLFRYMQPKRWGGMELDFVSYFDIPEMIGRGDASAAWTLANLASHHRGLALWDPRAQEELWGANPDVLIASGIAFAQGSGRKVDGGIELSGKWGFSSGVDVSQWNMLACVVRDADNKPIDYRMCLVPRSDYEIVDDWQTLGMRGTGSKTVIAKNVFVPEYRANSMHVVKPGHTYPGYRVNTNPMFKVPTPALGGYCIAAAMIGNAQHALDLSIELVKSRSTSYTGAKMRDFQTVQLRIGMAAARIDGVRTWLRNDVLEAQGIAFRGETYTTETKLRYKRNCAMGMKLVTEAVDSLHEMAGANGIYDAYPIQRLFRDAHAAAGHFSFSTDAQLTPWGLAALGGEVASPTL